MVEQEVRIQTKRYITRIPRAKQESARPELSAEVCAYGGTGDFLSGADSPNTAFDRKWFQHQPDKHYPSYVA